MKEGYLKRDAKFIYTIEGTEKKKYDNYLFKDTEFRKISKEAQDSFTSLEKYVCSFTFSNFGGIQTIGQEPLSDENLAILARFGKVFDLTYTRFNDLKLAEAQARESRIELALERVRARTMAMQQSEELGDVATVLFKELNELVENLWTCGFVLCEKDRPEDEWWLSTEEGFIPPLFLPNVGDATHHNIYEAWKISVHPPPIGREPIDQESQSPRTNIFRSTPGKLSEIVWFFAKKFQIFRLSFQYMRCFSLASKIDEYALPMNHFSLCKNFTLISQSRKKINMHC